MTEESGGSLLNVTQANLESFHYNFIRNYHSSPATEEQAANII